MDERIPVSLLTGFLGSGKTTLLNHWLGDPKLADAAVIVNEFGDVGIDHALIAAAAKSDDRTIELSTGCLCCTVRGDLVDTLRELYTRRNAGEIRSFARVLIETTGLADPGPVIQALITMPVVRRFKLGRIAATLDAVHGMATLDRHAEAVKQVAVADTVLITKADLGQDDLLAARARALNPGAAVVSSKPGSRPGFDAVFEGAAFDPAAKPEAVLAWLNAEAHEGHHHAHDVNRHDAHIVSFVIRLDTPVEWEHLAAWLDALVIAHGPDLLRVKGIVDVAGHAKPIVVQGVQTLFHPPAELAAWPGDKRESQIVFITRDLGESYVRDVLDTIRRRPVAKAS